MDSINSGFIIATRFQILYLEYSYTLRVSPSFTGFTHLPIYYRFPSVLRTM